MVRWRMLGHSALGMNERLGVCIRQRLQSLVEAMALGGGPWSPENC